MSVICPNCKECYSIKTDLFLNKQQKLQCVNCGYNWNVNFSENPIGKEEDINNLLLIRKDKPLTSSQVLKILKEEAEFDKTLTRNAVNDSFDKKTKNNEGQHVKELSFSELLVNKSFWFGFCISLIVVFVLGLIYYFPGFLSTKFPYLSNYLASFTDFVDSIRYWIDGNKNDLINFIRNLFI